MRGTDALTVTELLVVLAILGVLLGVGGVNYVHWRASSAVLEGVQVFTRAVTDARSGAKRLNVCQELKLGMAGGATSVNVGTFAGTACSGSATSTATVPLPPNVTVTLTGAAANSLTFQPPYGTTGATAKVYEVTWASDPDIRRTVRVTGVFGRVIVK